MARDDAMMVAIVAGAAVMVGYYLFTTKGGVLDVVKESGAAFGEWFKESTTKSRASGEVALGATYSPEFYVPPTPEGYNQSNWTWTLASGTKLGLPAGMTPGEFCGANPDAPICTEV